MTDPTALKQTAMRYAGISNLQDPVWASQMDALLDLALQVSSFSFTYRLFDLKHEKEGAVIAPAGLCLSGNLAEKMLEECEQIIVLGATLGSGFDRQLDLFHLTSPSKALCFDALGSALIDAKADELQEQIAAKLSNRFLGDRFSCGYGDLPLDLQKQISPLLDLPRHTGIHILDSCMMAPTKSITAFIGVSKKTQPARVRGCAYCSMSNSCPYKKKGTLCHV